MNTRERLAKKLNKHISDHHWEADHLTPAAGAWRTHKALDVFCWEGFVADASGIRRFVGSYQTMTELCKCDKFELNEDGEVFGWTEDLATRREWPPIIQEQNA